MPLSFSACAMVRDGVMLGGSSVPTKIIIGVFLSRANGYVVPGIALEPPIAIAAQCSAYLGPK
jgi:hypothetical protein